MEDGGLSEARRGPRKVNADIYFWDEAGFRADAVQDGRGARKADTGDRRAGQTTDDLGGIGGQRQGAFWLRRTRVG